MAKKLTQKEVITQFKKIHGDKYDYSKVKYIKGDIKVEIICPIHGSFWQIPDGHKRGKGCSKCTKNKTFKVEKIIKQFREIHGNKYDYSKIIYVNGNEKVEIVCPIHGSFWQTPKQHKRGRGCSICAKQAIKNTHPHLLCYLKNKKDENLSKCACKKIRCICPDCGHEKDIWLKNFTARGFICSRCSDGISIPEKFMINLLMRLDIKFETQYNSSWSNSKRYDFYLPKYNMIIETHGEQHYRQSPRGRSLQEEQENDKYKKELALKNGIENYIVVDCKYSTLEWLKKNCIKELSLYFDLSTVDWESVWKKSQKNILKKSLQSLG